MSASSADVRSVHGLSFHPSACGRDRRKRQSRPEAFQPQRGERLSLTVKLFGTTPSPPFFTLPHVKFINISPHHFYFFFLSSQNVSMSGSSCQKFFLLESKRAQQILRSEKFRGSFQILSWLGTI